MSPGDEARAVAAMVRGIAAYARWPVAPNPMRICITGMTALGDAWLADEGPLPSLRRVESGARLPVAQCDLAYIGRLDPATAQATYAVLRNQPVLTITDSDPLCRRGAMFCLARTNTNLSFSLNIDAATRSLNRIDPRVLRLARPAA